jgi:tRNA (cytidine/uridine-2'-O-)-methyltransferase
LQPGRRRLSRQKHRLKFIVFHVILHQPQIPPNTGNIIRLCANTGCQLHLIEPLGFELDRRSVRRAGLDYAELAIVRRYPALSACLAALGQARVFAVETGAGPAYSEVSFAVGDAWLFGSETEGLPPAVVAARPPEQRLSIPMRSGNRSLNLSNAVAVVVYEAWRQLRFQG